MIRLAAESDLNELVSFDHVAANDPQRASDLENAIKDKSCWVYVLDAKPVACAILNYHFFHQAFMSHLYVAQNYRRKGIGKILIGHLEKICARPKLFTSTNESNNEMQNLLSKLGYRQVGLVDGLDEGDPEMFFMKELPHDAPP